MDRVYIIGNIFNLLLENSMQISFCLFVQIKDHYSISLRANIVLGMFGKDIRSSTWYFNWKTIIDVDQKK